MKKILLTILGIFSFVALSAQVKIGENIEEISPFALLELESTDAGLILPRMTTAQRDAAFNQDTPVGTVIYNMDKNQVQHLHFDITAAGKNNPDKFPSGYIIELDALEKKELVENFHRLNGLKHTKINPKAFTEKGLYMLATILKSKQATQTTFLIIETFAKLRALQQTVASAATSKGNQKNNLLKRSGELMADLLDTDLRETEAETTLELNFAVLKLKHTTKRRKKE